MISSHEGISQGVRVCHFLLDHVSLLSAQENGSVQVSVSVFSVYMCGGKVKYLNGHA